MVRQTKKKKKAAKKTARKNGQSKKPLAIVPGPPVTLDTLVASSNKLQAELLDEIGDQEAAIKTQSELIKVQRKLINLLGQRPPVPQIVKAVNVKITAPDVGNLDACWGIYAKGVLYLYENASFDPLTPLGRLLSFTTPTTNKES
jgi:hypothetical protein